MNRRAFLAALLTAPGLARAKVGAQLFAFGDSITSGAGASDAAHRYVNRIAQERGLSINNFGVPGHLIAGTAATAYRVSIPDDGRSTALVGFNDMRGYGQDARGLDSFARAALAMAAWLAIPDSAKMRAGQAIASGSWARTTPLPESFVSDTPGDSLTFEGVEGSVIYVGGIALPEGGSFAVSVDGKFAGRGECSGAVRSRYPFLVRIGGLSAGPHRVVVTVESGPALVDWAGGNSRPCPSVYLAGPISCTPFGYKFGGGTNGSDEAVRLYNAAVAAAADTLAGDHLRVAFVDPTSWFEPSSDTNSPDVHPNDRGHELIAEAFLSIMPRQVAECPLLPDRRAWRMLGFFS